MDEKPSCLIARVEKQRTEATAEHPVVDWMLIKNTRNATPAIQKHNLACLYFCLIILPLYYSLGEIICRRIWYWGTQKHDLCMSFDEFAIIVRDFRTAGNKSPQITLNRDYLSTRPYSIFLNYLFIKSVVSRCRENSILNENKCHLQFGLSV